MIQTIYILNGPNLNLLGKRAVGIYGNESFDTFFVKLINLFPNLDLKYFQSNHEGDLIDQLHRTGFDEEVAFILNAGGLSHTSISLRDAVEAIPAPVVEVHISNIFKREEFRRYSYLTEVCAHHFIGHGLEGYRMAIEFLVDRQS